MAWLTSETHPLRIDSVETPGGGRIGMTLCPGKHQAHSISGHWARDLDADLAVIQAWGAQAVVTLMEPEELAQVGVAHLGDAVEARGLDWYPLPIRDTRPPGQRFENRWVLYGLRLRRWLRQGGTVLLHCRGGLGRTGTVAARLLVELGVSPQAAIQAVRAARPGTIETGAQAAHVLNARPPDLSEAFLDRALGCLLGGALGDGFGYAVEFDPLTRIQQRFGDAGLREPVLTQGQLRVSDDTQMTLFTLEGLTHAPREALPEHRIAPIGQAYADWLDTQTGHPPGPVRGTLAQRPALRHRRAPGHTCLSALNQGGAGTPERPINSSKGCGAVMRVAPIGWLTGLPPEARFDLAARAGALTHGHPDGWASAGLLATLIGALFTGYGLSRALVQAKAVTAAALGHHGARADLLGVVARAETRARRLRQAPTRAIGEIGRGWTGEEAVAVALYAVLSARDFADALQRAANHDGDSDSTAALAGQIWGAWKGVDSLPMAWVRRLDVLPECLHGVHALARQGHQAAPTLTPGADGEWEPMPKTRVEIREAPSDSLWTPPLATTLEKAPSTPEAAAPPAEAEPEFDWETIDPRGFDLSEAAGREAALIALYHQWEGALLPFTAKVWDSLTDPKEVKVGQMAQVLGLGGTGKATLHAILALYLKTTDAVLARIEDASDTLDFHANPTAWSEALARWFQEADRALILEAARWARLLNGEPMDPVAKAPPLARVLPGPWLKRD